MTFPLGSLRAEGRCCRQHLHTRQSPRPQASAVGCGHDSTESLTPRWRHQAWLIVAARWPGCCLLLALATHHLGDPGFSTSGDGAPLRNKAGMVGAWVSDLGLFLFGYSVWWLIPVGLRAWLSSLARRVRRDDDARGLAPVLPRAAFWVGLALLMAASCSLEWTRCTSGSRSCPAMPAGCSASRSGRCPRTGSVLPVRACCGSPRWWSACRWRWAFPGWRWPNASARPSTAARTPPAAEGSGRGPPHRRAGAGRARAGGRGRAPGGGGSPAAGDRADAAGGAQVRARGQGAAEAAVRRAGRHQAAAGRPARRGAGTRRDGDARVAGDDLAADREEAQGLRRRGARGGGLARPGDHALRDRAGHRRQGCAGGQPGQGPGALAVAGEHPRGRDHSRQELHGAANCPTRGARPSAWPRSWARRSTTTRPRC